MSYASSAASACLDHLPPRWHRLPAYISGWAISGLLAVVGIALGKVDWLQQHGFSALTIAIVLGMLVGNSVYPRYAESCSPGVNFSKQNLLRFGIVLYGLRLTLQDIGHVGLAGVVIDALVLSSTFAMAYQIGTRWLKLDASTAMLIGAGSSICGAAAVMAIEPVLRARSEQVTVAVASVVVFGTLAIFLYPVLYGLNQHWPVIAGGASGFGMYAGSTIHEVAQVVAVAQSVGSQAPDTAVITKMVRVMMLAPFLMLLSAWLARGQSKLTSDPSAKNLTKSKINVPWFAFAFVGVVAFNSLQLLPSQLTGILTELDTVLLAMAMAALGLTTHVSAIKKAGAKPLLLAVLLFGWLVAGGALINHSVVRLLA